ncbi:DUF6777 domain-containing protein [Streptomyces sp. NRRL F-2664]|uniref:DUF6777 domain-containing protein n=1 Tax=Streptomyces sp. NRRL F-2664 TaxID=1463842 RepID=UPI00068B0BAF|nr:DUF6777 domain-containing protein [Streptomyces sp. NRRL F-2664]
MNGPSLPAPRQASRRQAPAGAALFALLGLFAAACGGHDEPAGGAGPESQEVYLQPVANAGPDPFTASTATGESAPVQPPLPNPTGQGIRTVNAATPGLYGGTQRLGSCDVEQQVRHLTADDAKARAFAQATGIEEARIPDFLRGLTPVVLRADTRVTNHGFRAGRAEGYQSVLQAGTAVLVDEHGMPRVRCGCGNPLGAPRAAKGSPVHKGDRWNGYQPNQVVVVEPTTHVINNLVIVNITDNTWIERKRGDDGAQDRTPQSLPPYDPAEGIPNAPAHPSGAPSAQPCPSTAGAGPADCPSHPSSPSSPGGDTRQSPAVPLNPSTRPRQPQQPQQRPPSDQPSDVPSDGLTQDPSDPALPPWPGATTQPGDPQDPYADPYADPSDDPYTDPSADPYADPDLMPTSEEDHPLESA